MNNDTILTEIRQAGARNREAIRTWKDCKAGERGAFGRRGQRRKSSLSGLACPRMSRPRRNPVFLPLWKAHVEGTPLKCNGKDGYQRLPSGQIISVVR